MVEHRDFGGRKPAQAIVGPLKSLDLVDLGLPGPQYLLFIAAPAPSVFGFEIVGVAFSDALSRLFAPMNSASEWFTRVKRKSASLKKIKSGLFSMRAPNSSRPCSASWTV